MPVVNIDGIAFHLDVQGDGDPLVLLHGFTGSARTWQPIATRLSSKYRVVTIDQIGHGSSGAPTDTAHYCFNQALDDLAEIARQLNLNRAAWLGYSMGGRVAIGLALRHPNLVSSLILESASPGIADPQERAARQRADAELASRIEREGIDAFVDAWERLPLWNTQANLSPDVLDRQRQIRLQNYASGLAGSLRGMGSGAQPSLWERLPDLRCPILLIAGALDAKFSGIAERMAEVIPDAEIERIAGAGHAVHLERPEQFLTTVCKFLAREKTAQDDVQKEVACG